MRNDRGYVISGNITRSYYMHWKPCTLTYRPISHACQLPTTCCARGNPHQLEMLRHSMFSVMEKLSVLLPEQTEEELLQVVIFKMVLSGYLHICIQPGKKKCSAVTWQWRMIGLLRRSSSSAVHTTGSLAGHNQTWLRTVRLSSCQGGRSYASAKGLSLCTLRGNTEGMYVIYMIAVTPSY